MGSSLSLMGISGQGMIAAIDIHHSSRDVSEESLWNRLIS